MRHPYYLVTGNLDAPPDGVDHNEGQRRDESRHVLRGTRTLTVRDEAYCTTRGDSLAALGARHRGGASSGDLTRCCTGIAHTMLLIYSTCVSHPQMIRSYATDEL